MAHPGQKRILEKLETFERISLAVIAALDKLDEKIISSSVEDESLPGL
ncbi:hypothetical protein S726_004137 [Salmonella enterica subsp. enterica]|nr:hypothetical protein [Salmonella enterica subsp. enterica]